MLTEDEMSRLKETIESGDVSNRDAAISIVKHRNLSRRIAELLGEEESRFIMERLRRKAHEKEFAQGE